MANENAVLYENEELNEEFVDSFDFDELESKLESDLEEQLSDLDFLEKDKEMIANPDNLGKVVMNTAWEQFINQIGEVAGEDFIKANHGLKLDLRDEAHIQTVENFAEGKIVTHNFQTYERTVDGEKVIVTYNEEFQKRYDDWQSNFVKDENGNVVTHKTRSGKEEATLVKDARKPFDDKRKERGLTGSKEKGTDMDETISVAEIVRDPSANAYMTQEERIEFDLSEKNLNEIDSSWNRSKGDTPTNEWLDNTNSKGQKPQEIFDNMTAEDVEKLRQKDAEAREEFDKRKKEGEQQAIKAGKKSQKEEAFRIGGKALRAAIMGLLAELVKDIFQKFISWLKSSKMSMETLIEHLKAAVHTFIVNLKRNLITAANTIGTTIATAIIGPIVGTIKKAWMLLKQGANSIKEAVQYLRNPENRNKPLSIKIAQIGKIITTGLVASGAIVLSEAIEKGLMTFPVFAIEIPIIGSLANIIGIFLGAVISGIIGAIVINLIDKFIANKQKSEAVKAQVEKGNDVLNTQRKLIAVKEAQLQKTRANVEHSINERHQEANKIIREAANNILNSDSDENLDEIYALLNNM